MSGCFKNRKIGDRLNFVQTAAYNFDSGTERTSDSSSCDESEDTGGDPRSAKAPRTSWSVRDRMKGKELCSKITDETSTGTNFSDGNLDLPPIQELTISSTPQNQLIPKLENVTLDSDFESLTINGIAKLSLDGEHKPLAGVVTSVAKVIGLIVVKPPMSQNVLLHLGSPVFFRKSVTALVSKDVKLGSVIDVFGPACEPYYCVKPVNNGIELVHEGSELFYSPDHPRTAFLCLKQEDGNRFTVMYSPGCPSLGDRRIVSGQPGDDDFWSRASRCDFPHRQLRRRRRRRQNRRTYEYKNKDQNNFHSFRAKQPKHTYFDY